MVISSLSRPTAPGASRPARSASATQEAEAPPADCVTLSRTKPPKLDPSRQSRLAAEVAWGSQPGGALFGVGGQLLADSEGKIKHIALQLGNVEFDRPLPEETRGALLGMYGQLMEHLSPEAHFTVAIADARGEQDVRKLAQDKGIAPERLHIVDAQCDKGMSIWIRDSMLPVSADDGHTTLLIQDRTYWPGPDDAKVAPMIDAAHPQIDSHPHPALRIDGGNVLTNHNLTLVGSDSVKHTRDRLQELAKDPQTLQQMHSYYESRTGETVSTNRASFDKMWEKLPEVVFKTEFERPIFVIGKDDPNTPAKEEQPAFHIDMAVTPMGDKKWLVGDPGMAIEVFNKLSPEERTEVNRAMAAQAGLPADADLIGKLIEVNGSSEHQANFDNVAKELEGQGFEIERIPSLIGLRTTWSLPYLTYNNCMIETYGDTKKVFLPTYGCAPLDKMATETYERNGFEVVPLELSAVSKLEGAIRCSSYALERG